MVELKQDQDRVWLTLDSSVSFQTPAGRWVKAAGSLGRSKTIPEGSTFAETASSMYVEVSTVLDHLLSQYQAKVLK